MDDSRIIELFEDRDESAIREVERKYSAFLKKIARNVLKSEQDVEECLSDAYYKVWNRIPPEKPRDLPAFLGKITRDEAISVYRARRSKKRIGSEYEISLDELGEILPSADTPEEEFDARVLCDDIASYLGTLPERTQRLFVRRYFFFDPVKTIASSYGMSVSAVKTALFRAREGLKEYLRKEGFSV